MMIPLTTLFSLLLYAHSAFSQPATSHSIRRSPSARRPLKDIPARITNSWGPYSPWYPTEKYPSLPKECKITQVNILERHGARFPTKSAGGHITESIDRVLSLINGENNANPISAQKWREGERKGNPLAFLKDYTYKLGEDELVPLGKKQAYESGVQFVKRYPHLASSKKVPFVRSSGSSRVVHSAEEFVKAFSASTHPHFPPSLIPIHTIPEETGVNNTLDADGCPKAATGPFPPPTFPPDPPATEPTIFDDDPEDAYVDAYLDRHDDDFDVLRQWIAKWIDELTGAPKLKEGEEQTWQKMKKKDMLYLMQLCAFESVYDEVESKWCGVFDSFPRNKPKNPNPWLVLSHILSLDKYHSVGPGHPLNLGSVQGVGYTNELLARLTGKIGYVKSDHTNVNRTSWQGEYQLGKNVYVDFSHDSLLVSVYSALGMFGLGKGSKPRTSVGGTDWLWDGVDPGTKWIQSTMTPFSARMAVEKVECGHHSGLYVRILVNDALQPLEFCKKVGTKGDWKGLCALDAFVESQGYARESGRGDWARCFA